MFYLDCPYCDINGFLWAMFKVRPLDYEALTSCFLRISCPFDEKKEDIELMKNGSHEEVMKRIAIGKLGNRALTALFFRNNRKEFETYLDQWEKQFLCIEDFGPGEIRGLFLFSADLYY